MDMPAAPPDFPPERRQLSAGRLRRLLEISSLVRRNPRLKMGGILRQLSISRSQFYRDREELMRLGLNFSRQASSRGFTLAQDPLLPPVELSLSELLSLSAAVAALARAGEAATAYLGLRSLLSMVARLPEELRATLEPYVEEVVLGEGFGCRLEVLDVLSRSVDEGLRIVLRRGEESLTLDPEAIALHEGRLSLKALSTGRAPVAIPLTEIIEASATPFLAPEAEAASELKPEPRQPATRT
jgi:predicted DNA-binding transcriptional regulator YafY